MYPSVSIPIAKFTQHLFIFDHLALKGLKSSHSLLVCFEDIIQKWLFKNIFKREKIIGPMHSERESQGHGQGHSQGMMTAGNTSAWVAAVRGEGMGDL